MIQLFADPYCRPLASQARKLGENSQILLMSSEIWPQYAESFRAYDLDGDGYITRNDLMELESRLGRTGEFNQHIEQLWKFLAASLDADGVGALDRQQLREAIYDFTCVNHERNVRFWGEPSES